MAEKIPMTALSPTMEEGTITSWNVKEGDAVSAGDVLCEVETDKASMDYESPQDGTIVKIIVGEGGNARVGQTIAVFGEAGEDISALEKEVAGEGAAAAAPAPVEPAPAAPEPPAPKEAPKAEPAPSEPAATVAPSPVTTVGGHVKASPLAVKLAAERNINLALVKGSGPGGRVVKRDIENFRGVSSSSVASAAPTGAFTSAPVGEDVVIPVAGKRVAIARRVVASKFSAPHFYVKTSVEMTNIIAARKMLNEALPTKVSLNAFFIKFAAEALKRHPVVNSSWQDDKIVQYGSIDIGLAVDLGNGLMIPVVRDCGNRGIVDIDGDLQELIQKTGEGKLKPEEYNGATFTISNLGSFGVEEFTAIINPPGSAILALGASKATPVVKPDGSLGVGTIMKMTLSCDHRVIDGAAGGRFIHDLQQMMEQPVRMIF